MPAVEIIRNQAIANFIIQNSDAIQGKVLDVGCGTQPYRRLFDNDWTGLDIRPVAELTGDMTEIPCEDDTFDTVLCTDAMNFTLNPGLALKEMVRVCKPGGAILIVARTTAEDDSIFLGIHSAYLHEALKALGCVIYDDAPMRAQGVSGLFSRAEADNFWTNQTWLEGVNNADLERFTQYLDRRYPALAGVVVRKDE